MAGYVTAFHDLDKLAAAMQNLEGRISSVRMSIYKNQEELNTIILLQTALEENILELKKPGQVVMAIEFRKAMEDLKKTHIRMSFLKMNHLTLEAAFTTQTRMFDHLIKLYTEEAVRSKNNILQFDLGRRKK